MLTVRVMCPSDHTAEIVDLLGDDDGVAHIAVHEGASVRPEGDVVVCDVAREAADSLLSDLRALGVERYGGIALDDTVVLSEAAKRAEHDAPGEASDAVVWNTLERQTEDDTRLTWSYVVFLAVATQLAGIAVLIDSPILIVGAMVLGPEFAPLARISVALLRRRPRWAWQGVRTLVVGFAVAILVTFLCALVSSWWGWIQPEMVQPGSRPLTEFVVHPDRWSFIVAVLAGCAGVLSLTSAKSSSLVGVFISVTTVPAAANIAVALALGVWSQVSLSAIQLGVNLAGIIAAGAVTLLVQRVLWSQVRDRVRAARRARRERRLRA